MAFLMLPMRPEKRDCRSHLLCIFCHGIVPITSLFLVSFLQNLKVLHCAALGAFTLYPTDVLLADSVPCAHVLFHACSEAVFFAFREGCARLGDAAFKAVLVEFL